MDDSDFALLMEAKRRLEDLENRMPLASRVNQLHAFAFKMVCRLRGHLGLTDEQFDQIATPQGGGTPKTPPPDNS